MFDNGMWLLWVGGALAAARLVWWLYDVTHRSR